jgi:hypothetical protein
MVGLLELDRRDVAERFEHAFAVTPGDPLESRNALSTAPTPLRGPDGADGVRFVVKRSRWELERVGHAMSAACKSEGV